MPTEPTPRPHNAEKPVHIGLDHPQRDRCPERPPPSGFATQKIEIREPARRALVAAGCRSSAASAGHTARRARRAGLDRPVAAHGQVERRQRSQDLPLGGVWVVYFGERPRKRAPRADWARFRARRRWGAPRVVGGWWGAAGRAPRAPGRAPARVFVLSLMPNAAQIGAAADIPRHSLYASARFTRFVLHQYRRPAPARQLPQKRLAATGGAPFVTRRLIPACGSRYT